MTTELECKPVFIQERRKSMLTVDDLNEIAKIIEQTKEHHICKFTDDDVQNVKELASIFGKLKAKTFDTMWTAFVYIMIGIVILFSTHSLWKKG